MELMQKRITVTGGNGFLGTHLVKKLKEERGCEAVVHQRSSRLNMMPEQKTRIGYRKDLAVIYPL